eukprot:6850560-Pyramimonas_sp.AAC.1
MHFGRGPGSGGIGIFLVSPAVKTALVAAASRHLPCGRCGRRRSRGGRKGPKFPAAMVSVAIWAQA